MLYRFRSFSLDDRTRVLRSGTQRLQLRSKCFDALTLLVRSAGTTVAKTELMTTLWPGQEMDESSLTQVIYELRKTLDDARGESIVTVPGVGYRFTLTTQTLSSDSRFERYVDQTAVYESYAKGKYLLEKGGKRHLTQALRLYQLAAARTPSYAPAYLGLAQTWNALAWEMYAAPKLAYASARRAALRALELDPGLAQAYASLAEPALFFDRDWQSAAQAACEAIAMNPSLAPAHQTLAWLHVAMGDLDEAVRIVIRTIEMLPASLSLHAMLAVVYRYRGEGPKSISLLRNILEMDPSYAAARCYLGTALAIDGDLDEAIGLLEDVARAEPSVQVSSSLAYALARAGRTSGARFILDELQSQRTSRYVSGYSLALIHAGLGQLDEALAALRMAVDERAAPLVLLNVEPRFEPLRPRREFQGLLETIGLRPVAA